VAVAGITQVVKEQLVLRVNVATLAQQVSLAQQDHLEPRAREVKTDSLELPDSRDFLVRMDSPDLLDLRDSRDLTDSRDFLGSPVCLEWRVRRDRKARLVSEVHRVCLGRRALRERLATRATAVHPVRADRSDSLASRVNREFKVCRVQMVRLATGAMTALAVLPVTEVLRATLVGPERRVWLAELVSRDGKVLEESSALLVFQDSRARSAFPGPLALPVLLVQPELLDFLGNKVPKVRWAILDSLAHRGSVVIQARMVTLASQAQRVISASQASWVSLAGKAGLVSLE